MIQSNAATEAQLLRTAAPTYDVARQVFVGPPLAYVTHSLFRQGEPVTMPLTTRTTAAVSRGDATINVLDTTGYRTADVVTLVYTRRDTGQVLAARFAHTGKTSTSFTGVSWLTGFVGTIPTGATVTPWVNITERVIEAQLSGSSVWRDSVFDWSYSLGGVQYNSMVFPRDGSFLILERATPEGVFGYWSQWQTAALGYARTYEVQSGSDAQRTWQTTLESAWAYLAPRRYSARRYGEVNLADGATVTASPNLLRPYEESEEFRGGLGTTDAENVIDGNMDTVSISDAVPTLTPDPPITSAAEGGIVFGEVYMRPRANEPADLQWFVICAVPGYENLQTGQSWETGITLEGLGIGNPDTVYGPAGDPDAALVPWDFQGGGGYIRLPGITLGKDNPCAVFALNPSLFRERFTVESGVQLFGWRELGGFDQDGLTARNFRLNPLGGFLQLRHREAGGNVFRVRDMLAWGDAAQFGNKFWIDASDQTHSGAQWDDNNTVPLPAAGSSIRRLEDTNVAADWFEESEPLPGSMRSSNNGTYRSLELAEWVAHPANDITDSDPPTGGNLLLDTAVHLDFAGTFQIDDEQFHYFGRKAAAAGNIVRGANGTTPASHSTAALVYQVGEWFDKGVTLSAAITPASPATGGALNVSSAANLPSSGTIRAGTEHINYTGKTATTLTGITRGAGGTTAGSAATGTTVWLYDGTLGAHRLPMVGAIRWARQKRFYFRQVGNVLRTVNIAPCNVEIWASTDPSPDYPDSGGDWRLNWIGSNWLHTWQVPVLLTPTEHRMAIGPRRMRHVMMRVRQMSDYGVDGYSGRDKLNELQVFQYQIYSGDNGIENGEAGAGAVIRDLLEESQLFAPNDITIQAGALAGTSPNLPLSDGNFGSYWSELAPRYMLTLSMSRDNRVLVARHPFHPLAPRPAVRATFTAQMVRGEVSRPSTTIASRFGLGQVIVNVENEITGARFEGRYPPAPSPNGEIRRVPPVRGAFMSIDEANAYAEMLYLTSPEISDVFAFDTVGPCEWLNAGDRILLWVYHDDAKPLGEYVNCIVTSVEYLSEGYARVTAQEWRMR